MMEAFNCVIFWRTKDKQKIAAIRQRFSMSGYVTLNGWEPCEIKPEDMEVFKECIRRGFFGLLRQKWSKKGDQIIFLSH